MFSFEPLNLPSTPNWSTAFITQPVYRAAVADAIPTVDSQYAPVLYHLKKVLGAKFDDTIAHFIPSDANTLFAREAAKRFPLLVKTPVGSGTKHGAKLHVIAYMDMLEHLWREHEMRRGLADAFAATKWMANQSEWAPSKAYAFLTNPAAFSGATVMAIPKPSQSPASTVAHRGEFMLLDLESAHEKNARFQLPLVRKQPADHVNEPLSWLVQPITPPTIYENYGGSGDCFFRVLLKNIGKYAPAKLNSYMPERFRDETDDSCLSNKALILRDHSLVGYARFINDRANWANIDSTFPAKNYRLMDQFNDTVAKLATTMGRDEKEVVEMLHAVFMLSPVDYGFIHEAAFGEKGYWKQRHAGNEKLHDTQPYVKKMPRREYNTSSEAAAFAPFPTKPARDMAVAAVNTLIAIFESLYIELAQSKSYAGNYHVLAICEHFGINLVLQLIRDGNIEGYDSYVSIGADITIYAQLTGFGEGGHYTSLESLVADGLDLMFGTRAASPDGVLKHFPMTERMMDAITTNTAMVDYNVSRLATNDAKDQMYHLFFYRATMSYFLVPAMHEMFARVFVQLLDTPHAHNLRLLDQIRFVQSMLAKLLEKRNNGSAFYTDRNSIIRMPACLGLSSLDSRAYEGVETIDFPSQILHRNNIAPLQELVDNVSARLIETMYAAAVLVVYFMAVPPVCRQQKEFILQFNDVATKAMKALAGLDPTSGATAAVNWFARKTIINSMPTHKPQYVQTVTQMSRMLLLHAPQLFVHTAFYEYYCTLMGLSFEAVINNYSVKQRLVAPTNARMQLHHTAGLFSLPSFLSSKPAAARKCTLEVCVDQNYSRRYTSESMGHVLVWFTANDTHVRLRRQDATGDTDFAKFMDDTRIAYTACALNSPNALVVMPLDMDVADLGAVPDDIYMHFAMIIKEGGFDNRRGHAFIPLNKVLGGELFEVTLWEGPTDNTLDIEQCNLASGMQYEKVFRLRCKLGGSGVKGKHNEGVYCASSPSAMFDQKQTRAVCKYVTALSKAFSQKVFGSHSFLYLNMPLHNNIVPLWSVMSLPPIDVSLDIMVARLKLKLYDEGLTMLDFQTIGRIAFASVFAGETTETERLFQAYAFARFQWIMVQVIDPFNKICYRLDVYNGQDYEQMNYPAMGAGDCEDTAEAVLRFIRGIKRLPLVADPAHPFYYISQCLGVMSPCMCVLTTAGPAYMTKNPNATLDQCEKTGLHMMTLLVPTHKIDSRMRVSSKVREFFASGIPVETTGHNYNSYATPDYLLRGAVGSHASAIIKSIEHYNQVVCLAMQQPHVQSEKINFAMMINAEKSTLNGPGCRETGLSFVRSHYFYGRFVALCHDVLDLEAGRYLDFYYKSEASAHPSVNFSDVVVATKGQEWELRAPVSVDRDTRDNINHVCDEFAKNVQPITEQITRAPVSELHGGSIEIAGGPHASFAESLLVRSISFFINRLQPDSRRLMEELHVYMVANKDELGLSVEDVDTVTVIDGTITYYLLRVRF